MRARLASPTLLGTLSALLMTSPTVAGGYICWIDRVVTEGTAVRILFSPRGFNITGGGKSPKRVFKWENPLLFLFPPQGGPDQPGLPVFNKQKPISSGVDHT